MYDDDMRKVLFVLSALITAVGVYVLLVTFVFKDNTKGALQVTSSPGATVFLNGQQIGSTPLCKCDQNQMIPVGDYTIKLVPTDGSDPYEEKITINPSTITVVDRTFGSIDKVKGSVITLTKIGGSNAEVDAISFPVGTDVALDNTNQGQTPLTLSNVSESDHELTFTKDGYAPTTIRIHAVKGYRLVANVTLPVDLSAQTIGSPVASPSPGLSPTPTPSANTVTILQTPTGFLRVRQSPSIASQEVGQVKPGETYPYLDEKSGWTEITLTASTSGWVSSQYVKKTTPGQNK